MRNFSILAKAVDDKKLLGSIPGFHLEGPFINPIKKGGIKKIQVNPLYGRKSIRHVQESGPLQDYGSSIQGWPQT